MQQRQKWQTPLTINQPTLLLSSGQDWDQISYLALQIQSTRVSDDDDYGDEYGAGLNYDYGEEDEQEEEEAASTGEGKYCQV